MIVQHLTKCLGDNREVGMAHGYLHEIPGAQALEPKRGPASRAVLGQKQGPLCRLAEGGGEHRCVGDFLFDQIIGIIGGESGEDVQGWCLVGVRQAEHYAVVVIHALGTDSKPASQSALQRQCQWSEDSAAERGVKDETKIAELVPEEFQHHSVVGGQDAGRFPLVEKEGAEVQRSLFVQAALLHEPEQQFLFVQPF